MSNFINNYKKIVLENGLKVILYKIDRVESVYVSCSLKSGNDCAKDLSEIGIPHFLEHLSFRSTDKYKNSEVVNRTINDMGAYANALTSVLGTLFWIKAPSVNALESIDFLYQIIFKSKIREVDIEKEKNIVLSEYESYQMSEWYAFQNKVMENRLRNLEQYQFPITGKPEQISCFTKGLLLDWKKRFYNPKNTIVSVVGNFCEKDVIEKIEGTFGTEKIGEEVHFTKYNKSVYSDQVCFVKQTKSEQVWFDINWPVFGWKEVTRHKEMILKVMNNILGLGHSSKLNLILRGSEGVAYTCGSDVRIFPYLGSISVYGSVSKNNLFNAFEKIKKIIDELRTDGISEPDLIKIKEVMSLRDCMNFESPESISKYLTSELFDYGEIWGKDDYMREIKKVTQSEIKKLACKIFRSKSININLLGSVSQRDAEGLKNILKW